MSGQRRRSKRKLRSDAKYDAVIILSSSDDEEANRDLSLKIVEKARKREAKRKRAEEKPCASAQLPVIDMSSASSDDVEAVPPPEAESSAKKSKKKKAAAENMKMNRQPLVKLSMSSSSPVEPCSDIVPPTNKQHQQLGMSGMPPSNHANAPFGIVASTFRTITGQLTPKRHKLSDGFSTHQTTAANHQPSHYCVSPTETMNGDAGKSTYKEMTNRDWAGLTTEPLFCILERLPIKDYVRFGSVCLSWYQTVAAKLVSPAPHPPLLIVDPPGESTTHLIFNPFSNKVEFRLQEPSQLVPLSITTAGYIMYQHTTTAELVVKNPLTGSCLPFPSVTTLLPEVGDIYILSATALLSGSTITAVAIAYEYGYNGSNGYLCGREAAAFARLGDSNWTFFGDSVSVISMRFHKGLLYVLTTDVRILTWDPWVHPAPLLTLSTHNLAAKCSVTNWPDYGLVESSTGGDLLQVVNNFRLGEPLEYKVFKLDPAGTSGPKWCMMTSLCGEDALMLSQRGAVCISTRDFPELRQNCIYSTLYHEPEDALDVIDLGEGRVVNYLDVFDLGEGRVVDYLLFPEEAYSGYRDWFIPSLD